MTSILAFEVRARILILILGMGILIAGCASGAGGPGPRTWIDAPLDGSYVESGPVVVRSHAASEGGTSQAALLVNGTQVRQDAAADSSASLIEFAQTWQPEAEGEYTLQVITMDHEGNEGRSNIVRIFVGQVLFTETPTLAPAQSLTMTPTTPTPTEAITVTPVTPTLTEVAEPTFQLDQNANCRAGDSTAYDAVTAFTAGNTLTIEGRNGETTWFWVLIPGSTEHCWVAASTGTPLGPYNTVQVIVPPPPPATDTPTPLPQQVPAAPSQFNITGEVCSVQQYTVSLGWIDVAASENGYRVYRDGELVATLPTNSNSYIDTPPDYSGHSYWVESFNDAGSAQSNIVQEDGCIY